MTNRLARGLMTALAAMLALGTAATTAANAEGTLDKVREEGKLVVGVKADYKPYGYRDPSGNIVGIEPDLAKDVADDLGVELELVPVVASNRMQFLDQGRIDLMIATMTDTPERREVVQIVEPNYYSSGVNIIAPKSAGIGAWEDLRGKPVCGIQGAFYNKSTAQDYGAEIVAFTGTAEALNALKQGRCAAFVYDDSAIVAWLRSPSGPTTRCRWRPLTTSPGASPCARATTSSPSTSPTGSRSGTGPAASSSWRPSTG